MGPAKFMENGMWIIPVIMMILCFLGFKFGFFNRDGRKPPWGQTMEENKQSTDADTPLDILKKRYAKGEITKEDFENMKKDL